jgi:hypothetical protein
MTTMNEKKLNGWNWSDKEGKWVYIKEVNGKKVYKYSENPPEKFIELNKRIIQLNKRISSEKDYHKNMKIYKKMMELSKKMQEFRNNNDDN